MTSACAPASAERTGEPVHVVAVERRDERSVQEADELVRQPVALVLAILDLRDELPALVGKALEERGQQAGDLDDVAGGSPVEDEELSVLRNEADASHCRAVSNLSRAV
jgi:hypothetical protein